jgi:predicted metal-dependent hydrolase
MPAKTFTHPDIGELHVYKRRGTRSLRLSIDHDGKVRVTIPWWVSYQAGVEFAISKVDWVTSQRPARKPLTDNAPVGKYHHLVFERGASSRVSTRIRQNEVRIIMPRAANIEDEVIQQAARKAAIRALRRQAEQLLPQRLQTLAQNHDFTYHSVQIKPMKSRWGSCSSAQVITLNCYLMQLPWDLIDYVLLHELMHTRIMAHGPKFWTALAQYVPNLSTKRKAIRIHRPSVF